MQSVSKLDQNDTDVGDHRKDHFSDIFGLLLFA
jgi:hypothetical protein